MIDSLIHGVIFIMTLFMRSMVAVSTSVPAH